MTSIHVLQTGKRVFQHETHILQNLFQKLNSRVCSVGLLTYLLIYLLIPLSRVFVEKLTGPQLLNKFSHCNGRMEETA